MLFPLVLAYRPRVLGRGPSPRLDLALLAILAAAILQTLPLPRPLLAALTPNAARAAAELALVDSGGALPMSLDLQGTAAAIAVFGAAVLAFFTARQIFDGGGVRTFARGTAVVGLVLAAVAIAQEATGGGLMYWRWRPIFERTHPFGPFVNRNHYGTWAIMAIPLAIGYLTAHATAHHGFRTNASWRQRLVAVLDARVALLLSSASLMMVAVALSLSRSAMLGLAAALAVGGWLSHRRSRLETQPHARPALLVAALAVVAGALIIIRVPPEAIADRLTASSAGLQGRQDIWREAVPVIRDFWLTGTGVGTYQTAMALYQRAEIGALYNQAHNHYLQVAAEGGLLVGLPVVWTLWVFAHEAGAALERDRSGMYWLRVGAAAGLFGVAVQSVFETGLVTPANAALAAVVAGVLLHIPGRYGPPRIG